MASYAKAVTRNSKNLGLLGLGSLTAAVAVIGLGSGTANADIDVIAPRPGVTSRATQNSVIRINDFGVAQGVSEAELADAGEVSAFGEVRDTVKAVVGGRAAPYEGSYPVGPPMGDW